MGPFQLSTGTMSSTCNPSITYFFDIYIPEDALSPTHQLLQPGNDNPIVPPICPGMTENITVTEYGPGVTAPGGSPPPAGDKTYRVTIDPDGTQAPTSQSFDIEVSWTNP